MEAVTSVFVTAFNGIKTMGITDLLDVIIVAYLIYKVIWFVRRTNSYNLAKGVVLILIALWLFLLGRLFQLLLLSTGRVAVTSGDFKFIFTSWQGILIILIGLVSLFIYVAFDMVSTHLYTQIVCYTCSK